MFITSVAVFIRAARDMRIATESGEEDALARVRVGRPDA